MGILIKVRRAANKLEVPGLGQSPYLKENDPCWGRHLEAIYKVVIHAEVRCATKYGERLDFY
jgi:hypothetical protein